jgi:hypothetical protein
LDIERLRRRRYTAAFPPFFLACYVAIKAEMILTLVERGPGYGVLFFCFLSGFSETFVPNLLNEKDSHRKSANGA